MHGKTLSVEHPLGPAVHFIPPAAFVFRHHSTAYIILRRSAERRPPSASSFSSSAHVMRLLIKIDSKIRAHIGKSFRRHRVKSAWLPLRPLAIQPAQSCRGATPDHVVTKSQQCACPAIRAPSFFRPLEHHHMHPLRQPQAARESVPSPHLPPLSAPDPADRKHAESASCILVQNA